MLSNIIKRAMNVITPAHISAYQRDGAIHIPNLLNDNELALLQRGIEQNIQSPSPRAKIASPKDDPGLFFEDFCNWESNLYYKEFIFSSPISMVAGQLMKSLTARLYHDHLLVKERNTQQKTPWHQDQPYYNIEGNQTCSFWIPIDPVSRESTLEFIAGSHHGPWMMPRSFMDKQAKWFPEGSLTELPDIDSNRSQYPIIGWALNPGDVVCFHMLTLHAANGVNHEHRRRVFSVRFLGDDIRHAPRQWATSPDFPGLSETLAAGATMDHPLFPMVWVNPFNQVDNLKTKDPQILFYT